MAEPSGREEETPDSFKELMNELIKEGWTQSQIAEELGVHRSTVSAWMTKDSVPATYRASFIADAFDFSEQTVRQAIENSRDDDEDDD